MECRNTPQSYLLGAAPILCPYQIESWSTVCLNYWTSLATCLPLANVSQNLVECIVGKFSVWHGRKCFWLFFGHNFLVFNLLTIQWSVEMKEIYFLFESDSVFLCSVCSNLKQATRKIQSNGTSIKICRKIEIFYRVQCFTASLRVPTFFIICLALSLLRVHILWWWWNDRIIKARLPILTELPDSISS